MSTILYIANKNYSSWSLRPWVLMRALGLPFEERLVAFQGANGGPDFRTFSPTGKVPCLHMDDLVIWDSMGITMALADRHDHVWPAATRARAWAQCASAEMHSGFQALRQYCSMNCGIRIVLSHQPPALLEDLVRLDSLWQEGLRQFDGPYLAGEQWSAVDAFFAPVCFRVQTYGLQLSDQSMAYVDRMLAHPAMQDWYRAALDEPWVDAAHDEAALANGRLVMDLRRMVQAP